MPGILAQLWNGNLKPIDTFGGDNPEMQELEAVLQRCLQQLASTDHPQKTAVETCLARLQEYYIVSCEQAFCDGFSLGTKIITEALTDSRQ